MAASRRRVFVASIVAIAALIWTSVGAVGWALTTAAVGPPDEEAITKVSTISRATTIYDAHDRPVFTIFKEQRIEVPLSRVSPHLIAAIVALEDQRFFDHGGVDLVRITGAAWKNLTDGWDTQGGSTITQQLARLSFLTREKTLRRKLREIVLAARLERTYSKERILEMPIMTLQGAWTPDDHSAGGTTSMRAALRHSSNRAAVSMPQEIGIPTALQAAARFGLESVPGVWSLALGSGEVTLLSMTAAYASFANGGMRPTPYLIRRVESADGEVLLSARPSGQRAVSEATAFRMTSMLSDVVNGGTGSQAWRVGFRLPAAGQTGTTNDFRDAWFIGYTPQLATGVWVGYDQPRIIRHRGYAATAAVPLWGRFMAQATADQEPTPFPWPRSVTTATICRLSGKLATDACRAAVAVDGYGYPTSGSLTYTEYFARGTAPVDYCPFHTSAPAQMLSSPVATVAITTPATPAPAPVPPSGQTAQATQGTTPTATSGTRPEPPRPRRGFFDWLLRRGDRDRKPN
jgi:penicillin-binding protein 1A